LTAWVSSKAALPWLLEKEAPVKENPEFARFRQQFQGGGVDRDLFNTALNEAIQQRWESLSLGLNRYMNHPYQRQSSPASLIWTRGSTQVFDYAPHSSGPIVLLIPSLVNRAYILDLSPRRSLIDHLKKEGLRPWLVDWQSPGEEESSFYVADYVAQRLLPILELAYEAQKSPVSVVGYCMGGVMSIALAHLSEKRQPKLIKSLVLLGTPWDFHSPLGTEATRFLKENFKGQETWQQTVPLQDFISQWEKPWKEMLDFQSFVFSSESIQLYFHQLISPSSALQKFYILGEMSPSSEKIEDFIAVEEWVNDGVPLAAPSGWECFYGWGVENRLARHLWYMDGEPVLLKNIQTPALAFIAQQDRIVPPSSSQPLIDLMPHCKGLFIDVGHVGMIVGKKAPKEVWEPLTQWIYEEKPQASTS
jgi:polyhydroxyalkanoate synthase